MPPVVSSNLPLIAICGSRATCFASGANILITIFCTTVNVASFIATSYHLAAILADHLYVVSTHLLPCSSILLLYRAKASQDSSNFQGSRSNERLQSLWAQSLGGSNRAKHVSVGEIQSLLRSNPSWPQILYRGLNLCSMIFLFDEGCNNKQTNCHNSQTRAPHGSNP